MKNNKYTYIRTNNNNIIVPLCFGKKKTVRFRVIYWTSVLLSTRTLWENAIMKIVIKRLCHLRKKKKKKKWRLVARIIRRLPRDLSVRYCYRPYKRALRGEVPVTTILLFVYYCRYNDATVSARCSFTAPAKRAALRDGRGAALRPRSRWNVRVVLLLQTVWHSSAADHGRAFKEYHRQKINKKTRDHTRAVFYNFLIRPFFLFIFFFPIDLHRRKDKSPPFHRNISLLRISSVQVNTSVFFSFSPSLFIYFEFYLFFFVFCFRSKRSTVIVRNNFFIIFNALILYRLGQQITFKLRLTCQMEKERIFQFFFFISNVQ